MVPGAWLSGYTLRHTPSPFLSEKKALRFALAHELGHVFGLARGVHCENPGCLMTQRETVFSQVTWGFGGSGAKPQLCTRCALELKKAIDFSPRLSEPARGRSRRIHFADAAVRFLAGNRRWIDAESVLNRLVEEDPDCPELRIFFYWVQSRMRAIDRSALKIPDFPNTGFRLGDCYITANFMCAVGHFKPIIDLVPMKEAMSDVRAMRVRQWALEGVRDYLAAIQEQEAFVRGPRVERGQLYDAQIRIARLKRLRGDVSGARKALAKIKFSHEYWASCWIAEASRIYLTTGDSVRVKELTRVLLARAQEKLDLRNVIGALEAAAIRADQTLADNYIVEVMRLSAIETQDIPAWRYKVATSLAELGRSDDAFQWLELARAYGGPESSETDPCIAQEFHSLRKMAKFGEIWGNCQSTTSTM